MRIQTVLSRLLYTRVLLLVAGYSFVTVSAVSAAAAEDVNKDEARSMSRRLTNRMQAPSSSSSSFSSSSSSSLTETSNDTTTTYSPYTYNVTKLDCAMRELALEYAETILRNNNNNNNADDMKQWYDNDNDDNDWNLIVKQQIYDALRLDVLCGTILGDIPSIPVRGVSTTSTTTTTTTSENDVVNTQESSTTTITTSTNRLMDSFNNNNRLRNKNNPAEDPPATTTKTFRRGRRRRQRRRMESIINNDDEMMKNDTNDKNDYYQPILKENENENYQHQRLTTICQSINTHCIYVVPSSYQIINDQKQQQQQKPNNSNNNKKEEEKKKKKKKILKDGSFEAPLDSLHDAMTLARHIRQEQPESTTTTTTTTITEAYYYSTSDSTTTTTTKTTKTIHLILRQGIHTLHGIPLEFTKRDSNLRLIGYPGEQIWISGGISLSSLVWEPSSINKSIQVARISKSFLEEEGYSYSGRRTTRKKKKKAPSPSSSSQQRQQQQQRSQQEKDNLLTPLPKMVSLFTSSHRYIRARYPNADPEIDQWGYASKDRLKYSIPPKDNVIEWQKPSTNGPLPTFTNFDFSTSETIPSPGIPIKNNSAQSGYNWYVTGQGGVCSSVWGDEANSYWCSNASQGGWSEVDRECAMTGRLQLPVGMTYNATTEVGQRLDSWFMSHSPKKNIIMTQGEDRRSSGSSAVGGILHAWHSQSWSMHMFEIDQHIRNTTTNRTSVATDDDHPEFRFVPAGGRQGGRNWCRCDQCTYAAGWCGQHENPPNTKDKRLISGSFYIENILAELDRPGEYYFDTNSHKLYVYPNGTSSGNNNNDLFDLRLALLDRLVTISSGASNILVENIGFRDMAPTYMHKQWSAPSGGDWALHRGGAIFLENVQNITIRNCHLFRLDGNAIFLSRRTRNVTIEHNRFEWLGENAIATWGDTAAKNGYDGTDGNFPMFTTIQYNVFREVGIYQKQSSAVGQAKAALTTIRNNIMFNMPRAAINFNDMLGGGDVVEGNLIFNTCRESGDHGPINTWDRQAFLTTLRDGSSSFDPLPRIIANNFIFANYGASQGIDNDDGSSWHHISRNVFYMAEGFKMDYGGHDSIFEDNLVLSYPYDGSNCFNMGDFLPGHGDVLRRNTCVIGLGNHQMGSGCGDPSCASPRPIDDVDKLELVGMLWAGCGKDSIVTLEKNQYYTPQGKAKIRCGDDEISLEHVQKEYGLELGSTGGSIPVDENVMVDWAKSMLFHNADKK